ncbi:hypothetical protein C1645_829969 [Glomus cerebriforme]|uniref:Uncharacterized protein n=1 Tax=Glomus cerebriforme TaxID=658196 RepID=A0A397SIY2_9GLOM|nr:hypothetical protein C1645_829969 [Glomus cerebriforme]
MSPDPSEIDFPTTNSSSTVQAITEPSGSSSFTLSERKTEPSMGSFVNPITPSMIVNSCPIPQIPLTNEQQLFIENQKRQFAGYDVFTNTSSPFLSISYSTQVQFRRDKKSQKKAEKRAHEQAIIMREREAAAERQRVYQAFKLQLNEESVNIKRSRRDPSFVNALHLSGEFINLLTDYQDNFHASMNNSPIKTLAPPVSNWRRKWFRLHKNVAPTLENSQHRFTSTLDAIKRDQPVHLPVFKNYAHKRPSSLVLFNNEIKRTKLLLDQQSGLKV